jgi:hypothetical protein
MRSFLVTAALVLSLGAFAQRVPPNSYLAKPVSTTSDLVRHVNSNPVVLSRYMRHFQMTQQQLIAFLSTLRVDTLMEATYFEIFGVPKSGELKGRKRLLKRGEKIFVDANSVPILKWDCGNPLLRTDEADVKIIIDVSAPSNPVSLPTPEPEAVHSVSMFDPPAPVVPNIEFVAVPEEVGISTLDMASPEPPRIPGFIAFLPTAFMTFISTGGTDPIPEPATLLSLGAGCAYLIKRSRRSRRA